MAIDKNLQESLPKIRQYLSGQPVNRAWLFGSYSRGEETDKSDVDILVQYDRSNSRLSLMKISGMIVALEDILHKTVDLVEDGRLLPFARESADRDKVLIYERKSLY